MTIRYIKLGEGGRYAQDCIHGNRATATGDCIRLGYETPQNPEIHDQCLRGNDEDWDFVQAYWREIRLAEGANPETVDRTARNDRRQIRDFYALPQEVIWFTFHGPLFWWCQALEEVEYLADHTRVRKTLNGWRSVNDAGRQLSIDSLDGRLTQIARYQGTICDVGERHDYLQNKIRGIEEPEIVEAKTARDELHRQVKNLIQGLWWHDFEILVDLIFSRAGWQRISILGKTEKGYDMILVSPLNDRRAFVQVKSRATLEDLNCYNEFLNCEAPDGARNQYEKYFVVHTPQGQLLQRGQNDVHVIGPERLAKMCVNSGLVQWLIDKRS